VQAQTMAPVPTTSAYGTAVRSSAGAAPFAYGGVGGMTGATPNITRPSTSGRRLAQPTNMLRASNYNVRAGPVQMAFSTSMGVAYNTNVNLSEQDPIADFVLTPRVGMNLYWPVTRLNNLSLNLGLGYNYYLNNPDLGGQYLLVSPATEIMFNLYVRDVRITLYTRPSITENSPEDPTLTDVIDYTVFNNVAGIDVMWDLNDVMLGVGYANQMRYSLNDEYSYWNSISNQIYANASMLVQPFLRLGVEGSVYNTTYLDPRSRARTEPGETAAEEQAVDRSRRANNLNDSVGYTLGLFGMGNLTRLTAWTAGVGWQVITFDEANNPLNTGNASNPYFYLGVTNELNRFYTHRFGASFESQPSFVSNFVETLSFSYGFDWALIRNWSLNGGIFYQHGLGSPGPETENFDRLGLNVSLGYQVTKNLVARFYYSVIDTGSTVITDSYNQQIFGLNLTYNF
jgi:hypothetical protein